MPAHRIDTTINLRRLQTRQGDAFPDPGLLQQAPTHRSHRSVHDERLEFLGEPILNCVVAPNNM